METIGLVSRRGWRVTNLDGIENGRVPKHGFQATHTTNNIFNLADRIRTMSLDITTTILTFTSPRVDWLCLAFY